MRRINEYKQTEAMAIDVMVKGMPGRVYNLAAGDPDLDLCDALKTAYRKTDLDRTHNYCSSQGTLGLRSLIWHDPSQVIIADGAKQLIYESLAAVTRPGDKVLLVGPCWTSYMKICEILGLEYRLICGDSRRGYAPTIHQIEADVTSDTCAIVMNNPNNPTGHVMDDETVGAICRISQEYDTWIICDEIYKDISEVPVPSLRGRRGTIVIDGFSKSLNMTGWRLGYAIADEKVIRSMTALQSQISGPPSTIIQDIVERAWKEKVPASFSDYRERIDILCILEKFRQHRPRAGFYFYVPIDDRWKDSVQLCEYMLREHSIAITPGDSYGIPRTVRISVAAVSVSSLKEILGFLTVI